MDSDEHRDSGPSEDDLGLAKTATPPAVPVAPRGDTAASLGERPASDKLVRAVARSKIAEALFAKKDEVKLGRYHLLEMVGAGGMGVVWGAYDPELDRRVAIKLVKATMQAARDRILLEGQALAKLSHPNVVPVYDVGVVDEQVYLVMEWVRGKNLRLYCKQSRTVRELVAIYRAAGEGLAAAHRAGLIHRDFKPDNAILGDDDRVRVLDFGLARGDLKANDSQPRASRVASSDLTRGAGTPRYMPVEQAEGRELTPAVDQYALCVSLREALVGRNADGKDAEVPRWLAEIVDKGSAREAAQRYESMDALLRALARDPATVWRRRLLVAGAVAAAGAAFAIGTLRASGAEVEHCIGGKDEITRTWSPQARAAMRTHLRSLGAYGVAEGPRLEGVFDRYAERWATAHRDACLARERGELTAQLYERNLGCLARTEAAFDESIDVLSSVTDKGLADAVAATNTLPDSAGCLSESRTATTDPPPAAIAGQVTVLEQQIQRARVRARAMAPNAIELAAGTAENAERLGYKPLIAQARLEHGMALLHQKKEAIPSLIDATDKALEANDTVTAIEAFAQAIHQIANADARQLPPHAAERLGAIPLVMAMANGLAPSAARTRAQLYNNVGLVQMFDGNRAEARLSFLAAIDEWKRSGQKGELSIVWSNLALVTTDLREREQHFQTAIQQLADALGPDHPAVLSARVIAGIHVPNPERALAQLREPCRRYQMLHPHLPDRTTDCWYEIGWIAEERGLFAEAKQAMAEIKVDSLERRLASGYLGLLDGKHSQVVQEMTKLADELLATKHVYNRTRAVDALIVATTGLLRLDRRAEALATLSRAHVTLNELSMFGEATFYQRRLARVRATLARLERSSNPKVAAEHTAAAVAWYRAAGGYDAIVAELTAGSR